MGPLSRKTNITSKSYFKKFFLISGGWPVGKHSAIEETFIQENLNVSKNSKSGWLLAHDLLPFPTLYDRSSMWVVVAKKLGPSLPPAPS